jgi:hypothetical protein
MQGGSTSVFLPFAEIAIFGCVSPQNSNQEGSVEYAPFCQAVDSDELLGGIIISILLPLSLILRFD